MTTLLTPKTRFLHAPKTGGTWVTAALAAAGVPCQPLWMRFGSGRRGHAALEQTQAYQDRFTFAFVRHPLELYRSRWAASVTVGWPHDRALHYARSDDFATFVTRVIDHEPGYLTRHLEQFTGPPDRPISFIGRYESLVEDLVRALTEAGEDFDEVALRAVAPTNQSDYTEHRAIYDEALRQRVLGTEAGSIERWYAEP